MNRFINIIFTKKKTSLPYIFEFLLLFSAVFLGFLVENYREQLEKENKAKSYIQGVIGDVNFDQQNELQVSEDLDSYGALFLDINKSIDSLMADGNLGDFYKLLKPLSSGYKDYHPIKSSYSQLSNGGFALISDLNIVDSINSFYSKMEYIEYSLNIFSERVKAFQNSQLMWFNGVKAQRFINDDAQVALSEPLSSFVFSESERDINTYFIMTRTVGRNALQISTSLKSLHESGNQLKQFLKSKLEDY